MPSTTNYVNAQLRHLIYYHLDCNLPRNALFFAGRLHAYEPRSSDTIYLLAQCHLQLGQIRAAYDHSRIVGVKGTHLGCSYIFAQTCLGLGKYTEGLSALERCKSLWLERNNWNKHGENKRQHLPDAAAIYCLQGKLWQAQSEQQQAIECYAEALRQNPFMWDAFTALCDLGANVCIPNVFKMTPEMINCIDLNEKPSSRHEEVTHGVLTHSTANVHVANNTTNDPFAVSKHKLNGDVRGVPAALYEKLKLRHAASTTIEYVDDSPQTKVSVDVTTFVDQNSSEPPGAPVRRPRGQNPTLDSSLEAPIMKHASMRVKSKTCLLSDDQEEVVINRPTIGTELKRTISGKAAHSITVPRSDNANDSSAPQRKSVRLLNLNQLRPHSSKFSVPSAGTLREDRELRRAKAPSSRSRTANAFNVGRVVSGNRRHGEAVDVEGKDSRNLTTAQSSTVHTRQIAGVPERTRELEALQMMLDLCLKMGTGYFLLCHYQCQHAIETFQSIPTAQKETPWVLAQLGRAFYERRSYADAERIFSRLRSLAPSRLEDLEYFSSCLWQLKKPVELAFLAHELIELDRQSPQAWCAVGNSFSLQRDHDQALKCFKRATQLDPSFGYAFTLQGHEHIANEEYDKAMTAYRASIAAESRQYNAWYGLGQVFERQGKYSVAEQHYRTAASINPSNTALVTCIGVMLERQGNPRAAFVKYSEACELDPHGTLWRYKKSRVLEIMHRTEESLVELCVLKDLAPDDACVHFSLGRVYKKLHQNGEAIKHFTTALTLDPKASHKIKEAMERLDQDSDEDMDM